MVKASRERAAGRRRSGAPHARGARGFTAKSLRQGAPLAWRGSRPGAGRAGGFVEWEGAVARAGLPRRLRDARRSTRPRSA